MREGYIEFDRLVGERIAFSGAEVVVAENSLFFWKPPAVFSQWTKSEFEVDGEIYNCAEQFMMSEKARLFDDHEAFSKILGTQDPREQKALGQQVHGFSERVWRERRQEIVIKGNYAKFIQDRDRKEELLETGEVVLVEASPLDRIWGIGLRADDPKILDSHQWQGLNLLGTALMSVRTMLRAGRVR